MAKTIKEIEQLLFANEQAVTIEQVNKLEEDERKGVQKLVNRWKLQLAKEQEAKHKFQQMSRYENQLRDEGISFIAGVDEVGRGPLAGPVVAASVILPTDFYLAGLNDSKAVSETKREQFFTTIKDHAIAIGVGVVSAKEVDKFNIYEATKIAMCRAVEEMNVVAEHLLIDAMELSLQIPQTSIIKGDANSVSIAASSIIAKVTRDRMMKELDKQYPQYGFKNHMGYGTKEHLKALALYGVTSEHRQTFAPVRNQLKT